MTIVCKMCSAQAKHRLSASTGGRRSASDAIASHERVDNLRVTVLRPAMPSAPIGHSGRGRASLAPNGPVLNDVHRGWSPRAVVETRRLWSPGRTLRVTFLDGLPAVQSRVEAIASEWQTIANIKLKFVTTGSADLRISFADKGDSWSTVGTEALDVAASKATMNYGWLDPDTSLRDAQAVVRHEFGHALGMVHEHQSPTAAGRIPWDKPAVYAYYKKLRWTKREIDFNIFALHDVGSTNFTRYDPKSIMHYPVDDALTLGTFSIPFNTRFSARDITFMAEQYPKDGAPIQKLTLASTPVEASLSKGGEVDTFRFDVRKGGTYTIATQGPTNTVMVLFGPDDRGAMLAFDDDNGRSSNARIVRHLLPGSYWVTVQHKLKRGKGNYTIALAANG